jgi:small subunit ribosomal protein S20
MNKKQRNRKIVAQNKRNRLINRRYTSTIKTLFKLLVFKTKSLKNTTVEIADPGKEKLEVKNLVSKLYSVIDKAIKKTVIHKNTAARKKSRISRISSNI